MALFSRLFIVFIFVVSCDQTIPFGGTTTTTKSGPNVQSRTGGPSSAGDITMERSSTVSSPTPIAAIIGARADNGISSTNAAPLSVSIATTSPVAMQINSSSMPDGAVISSPTPTYGATESTAGEASNETAISSAIPTYSPAPIPDGCPVGYVPVPADPTVGANTDFCVAKYEMKNVGQIATSQISGAPWVFLDRATSVYLCQALGIGYDLISNAQWQAIARNIESNPVNWNGGLGPVGVGTMRLGNSNSLGALAASSDSDPNFGLPSSAWVYGRADTLRNGQVIWDLAGNVMEWVKDEVSGANLFPSLTSTKKTEYSDLVSFPLPSNAGNRKLFAPSGNYDSSQNVGVLLSGGNTGGILRGGAWANSRFSPAGAGVFAAQLGFGPYSSGTPIGFRCVYTRP